MSSRKHSTEQIIRKLREAEVELAKGRANREVCKHLGITDHPTTDGARSTAVSERTRPAD